MTKDVSGALQDRRWNIVHWRSLALHAAYCLDCILIGDRREVRQVIRRQLGQLNRRGKDSSPDNIPNLVRDFADFVDEVDAESVAHRLVFDGITACGSVVHVKKLYDHFPPTTRVADGILKSGYEVLASRMLYL